MIKQPEDDLDEREQNLSSKRKQTNVVSTRKPRHKISSLGQVKLNAKAIFFRII